LDPITDVAHQSCTQAVPVQTTGAAVAPPAVTDPR
jgi:hypothetical protein